MKKFYIIFAILVTGIIYNVSGANITVDGDLSEWTNQPGLTNVAEVYDTGGGTDILTNGIAADANNIYFYFILAASVPDWNFLEVYIDTNNLTTDGTNGAINGDALTGCGVEYGYRLQSPLGDNWGNDWAIYDGTSWNIQASDYAITHATNAGRTKVEMSIPLSQLGLEAGDTIGIRFHTRNTPTDDNPSSGEIQFTIPLPAPQNVKATAISNNKVVVYWDKISGVTSYTVFRATSLTGPTNKVGGTTGTVFTDTTVANAFTSDYYYWVKAYKGSSSPYSEYALNSQGYAVISVDGAITEWTQSRKGIVKNEDLSGETWGGYEILTNSIANDDTYLYIYYNLGANVDWIDYNVYIDVDNNEATGIHTNLPGSDTSVPMATFMGAEYGYRYTGSGGAFSWYSNSGGVWASKTTTGGSVSSSANIIEIRIPLSEIKVLPGYMIGVVLRSEATGASDYDQNNNTSEIKYCIVGGTPPPAPAPSGVSAFIQSDTSINISWQAVSGATSYKIYRNTVNNSGSATEIATGITTTSYNDTSVSSALSTKYYYWVKSVKTGAPDSGLSSVAESKSYITIDDFDSYGNNTDLSNVWSVYVAWNGTGEIILTNNLFKSNLTYFYVAPDHTDGGNNDDAILMQKNLSFNNHTDIVSYVFWTKAGSFPGDSYFYFGFNNYVWDNNDNATFTHSASNYIGMSYFKQIIINKNDITPGSTFSGWNNVSKILLGIRETDAGGAVNTSFYIDKIIGTGVNTNTFPSVSATSPADNSTYSMTGTSVPVSFTIGANMTNISFQILTNNTFMTMYRQPDISYDGNIASMNISLPEGTNSIVIDAVNKVNGLPLKQYILTFNVIMPPTIKNLAPPDGGHQVATNTNIRMNIVDNQQVVSNSILIKINNNTALSNGSFLTGWDGASSSINRVGNVTNYSVVIDKSTPYNNNTKYTLTIIARDNNNNLVTNISYFYTPDTVNPEFNNFNPSPENTINPAANIYFEADDNLAVNSNEIVVRIGTVSGSSTNWNTALTNGGFNSGYSGNILSDGNGGYNVTVNPDTDFTAGEKIYIFISMSDFGNNSVTTNFYYEVQSDFDAPITSLSKPAGSYVGAIDLTLSVQDTSDYWIYYTTDGSDPLTSNTVVSNFNSSVTFQINSNTTVKYYSKDIYNNVETVKTATYEILNVPASAGEIYNNYCDLSKGDNIRFVLRDADSDVVIKVYNLKGKLVWKKEVGATTSNKLIEWDGTDSNGRKVGAGVYIVWIKGSETDIKRKIIIVK